MQRGYVYMLKFRKKDSKELIKRMAKTNGCLVAEIRREMQYAIEEARNSDDPDKQAEFQRLFGNKIPSPEEFICVVSNEKSRNAGTGIFRSLFFLRP